MDRLKALWVEEKRLDRLSVQAHYREDREAMARIRREYLKVVDRLISLVVLPERRNTPGKTGRRS
ncbi:MAG TPA: hypothetical protein DDW94_11270 [Deltaproteobacteria bacterium]|nr:MAG: hypothetical protein A2Z79_04830 [Deltaproteobacteria bacterium GWA2_55_82]OIJ72649.1 MAG: hypothetical protein A2V21_312400 [Deltaproteobacteria bacterium GWC2_55_46]HBG47551.1 hypothetical protein [Deltaproteobacteria bacterium]HCY10462.1 hypothetical protein [Deltaproteobacteria bacterium]